LFFTARRVEDAAGRLPGVAFRIPVSISAPKGAATKDESVCEPGWQATAEDCRGLVLGDNTEKPKEYPGKNRSREEVVLIRR